MSDGKDYLLVFDFVDKADRYAQSLNVHRVFGKSSYRPGALVAPDNQMAQETSDFGVAAGSAVPAVILGLNIYDTGLQPIDVFRWQDEAADMMPASELARELRVDDDTIRQRVKRNEITPDLSVPVGEREYQGLLSSYEGPGTRAILRASLAEARRTWQTRHQHYGSATAHSVFSATRRIVGSRGGAPHCCGGPARSRRGLCLASQTGLA
ncbi:MAG: hypothetical protein H7Y20_01865 [Bryobacteraceae bacterium]|nr:hypothetical protein [Bryobacteraceae bacterium]